MFDIPYRKDRTNHGGGLLVYLNKNIIHSRIPELESYCNESIWIKIKKGSEMLLLGTFYSPKTADVAFFNNLNNNLEKAYDISQNLLLLGDFNEDLFNCNYHNLKDLLYLNSLKNIINEATRGNAILDPIIVPTDFSYLDNGTITVPSHISDHKATYIILPFSYSTVHTFERNIWLYNKANFESLNNKIKNFNWNNLLNCSINEACRLFTNTFIDFVKECIPSKTITVRPDDKPWFDSKIRKFCRLRDRLKANALKTGKQNDWDKYKKSRNKVNNLKKYAKEHFFNNLELTLNDLQSNDKRTFWKVIKHFVKGDTSTSIPPLSDLTNTNNFHITTQNKAECLNDYFASISSVDDSNVSLPCYNFKTQNKLNSFEISEDEIIELIKLLPLNKACGHDLISHRMLKPVAKSVAKPLSILYNRSLNEGVYPDVWKVANITPIFKKGDKSLVSNYRPVSLLSCCGKLFERLVFKNMYNFFLENNLLYKYQSGFLPNHSTSYQLVDIYHHICQTFDNKQYSCMVFCDISKAFDRVWHRGLLFKLKENGIDGQLLLWLTSYLNNRSQRVVFQATESSLKTISAGVPQGSVLGPLLFLIYVNDIAESLLSLTRLYADDSSLYYSASSVQDIEGIINHDLTMISHWAQQWLVNFNPSKTEAMFFSLRGYETLPSLYFNNTQINFVDSHKHLGLTLSNDGKWSEHIENILCTASKTVGIMRKLKYSIGRKALNQIYLSYVRPILEYSCLVWNGCTDQNANSLEKLQNEAARIVTGLTRSVSLENLYRECGWESLKHRRTMQQYYFMYKVNNNSVPSYINDLFPPNVRERTNYNLRNREDLSVPYSRTEIMKKSCIPSSISLWNQLDWNLKNAPSLTAFKQTIKKETLSKVPSQFYHGKRQYAILLARIRNNCSNLNNDLFNNHLHQDNTCPNCGAPEDAEHYFFKCTIYRTQRLAMFYSTRPLHPLSTRLLLFGDNKRSNDENIIIVDAVLTYIKDTKRF